MQRVLLTKQKIIGLLKANGGRPGLVAEAAGTYRAKVYRAMKRYGIEKEPYRPQPHRGSRFYISKGTLDTPLEKVVGQLRQGGLAHRIYLFIQDAATPPSTRDIALHFALSMKPQSICRARHRINAILHGLKRRGPVVLIPAKTGQERNILVLDDRWTLPSGFWTRL